MKAAETKTSSVANQQKTNMPFFGKGEHSFFSGRALQEQGAFFGLQRSAYGLSNGSAIQTKLTIGQPNDIYEKEADTMADKVVQRLSNNNPDVKNKTGNTVQTKPAAQVSAVISSLPGSIQTKCAACEQEDKLQKTEEVEEKGLMDDKLQKKPIFESNARPPDDDNKNVQRKCAECEKEEKVQKGIVQKQESTSADRPVTSQQSDMAVNSDNIPQEVYFTRNGIYPVAIPKTATDITGLAKFLFKAANISDEENTNDTSPLTLIVTAIKNLNGFFTDYIYPKQQVLLGDLSTKYALTSRVAYLYTNGPIFGPPTTDPEAELLRMGVSTIDEFITKKFIYDSTVKIDITVINMIIKDIVGGDFFKQRERESQIMSIIKKWINIPLAKNPANYPNGGYYFDMILNGMSQNTFVLHNILTDEWTSSYDVMFNRFVYYKDDLQSYLQTYSYLNKNTKAIRELSLWEDFGKQAVMRIPAAITEEASCFFKSIPLDAAKNVGEHLHGISSDYLDAVLPDEKEANAQTQEIACTFGEIVFDLAGPLAKVKKVIDAISQAEELYKAFKEVDSILENLPDMLELFGDSNKLFDALFAINDAPALNRLETWVTTADAVAKPTAAVPGTIGAPKTGLAKFRKVITDMIAVVKTILKPVFAIRRKFLEFMQNAKDALLSNPVFEEFLLALKAGKKNTKIAGSSISQNISDLLVSLLSGVKETAERFIKGIAENVTGTINGFKDSISSAIADFALAEIKNMGGTVKVTLSIPAIKARISNLISSKLIGPFIKKAGFDIITSKIASLVNMLTTEALTAVDYVVDGFASFVNTALQNIHVQLDAKSGNHPAEGVNGSITTLMSNSHGFQMSAATGTAMEQAFGENFNGVRVHTDEPAIKASEQLSANAFTNTGDIYFNAGKYDPYSLSGKKLLAHELTHVLQQGKEPGKIQRSIKDVPEHMLQSIFEQTLTTTRLRAQPGVAEGGEHLPDITGKWMEDRRIGLFPGQIARRMRGMHFKNFADFRQMFWKMVAADPVLSQGWSQGNLTSMRRGNAPGVGKDIKGVRQSTGGGSNAVWQLNHILALDRGGGLYDMGNIEIVTPVMHQGMDPRKKDEDPPNKPKKKTKSIP